MPLHAFALNHEEGIGRVAFPRAPNSPVFSHSHRPDVHAYRLIEGDEFAEYLQQKDRRGTRFFRYITAENLENALGGTAQNAVDAVEAGEHDDVLDLLLLGENHYGPRDTVTTAIVSRHKQIEDQIDYGLTIPPVEEVTPPGYGGAR